MFSVREARKTETKGLKMINLAFGGNSDHNSGFRDLTNPSFAGSAGRARAIGAAAARRQSTVPPGVIPCPLEHCCNLPALLSGQDLNLVRWGGARDGSPSFFPRDGPCTLLGRRAGICCMRKLCGRSQDPVAC